MRNSEAIARRFIVGWETGSVGGKRKMKAEDSARSGERLPVGIVESRETGKRQKTEPITFTLEDQLENMDQGIEALVFTIDIMGVDVQRVMVNTSSSVNVLYLDVIQKLNLDPVELTPIATPLSGFTGDTIHAEGKISLPMEIGTPPRTFPIPAGVGVLRGDVQTARKCYSRALNMRDTGTSQVNTIAKDTNERRKEQPGPCEEVEEVLLHIFAWGSEDMTGIDRAIVCHHLAVNLDAKPVKQKTRHLSTDRREFIREEVKKMASISHIRPAICPDWVANIVLVPMPPSWQMCIDFTDLNKACPLDPYPLLSIHQMVDVTIGAELMSFMDAFKSYHQVMMAQEDESKTSFIKPDSLYCDRVMPFGLRNAGATYQWTVNTLFEKLLGHTMEAYINDMLVKSRNRPNHARDLR
ncbi:PREDICTED: uncharacterized protein LOC109183658 [Ipomoea nil]|uniref:uncharacterized protein LOC109183658 n=1 Tax=Ipomoea nil TaxID=35883 RepID=UPI000900B730|nr:PREDICTED: uncharacterized protein LOC109183658 [Ipomoea nil]